MAAWPQALPTRKMAPGGSSSPTPLVAACVLLAPCSWCVCSTTPVPLVAAAEAPAPSSWWVCTAAPAPEAAAWLQVEPMR